MLLLCLAASPATPAELTLASADEADRLAEQIRLQQEEGGAYSPALIDAWESLARLYEQQGRPALAAAAIEGAMQVIRANFGLFSLEQAPLMRRLIDQQRSLGDAAGAWAHEQELLRLASLHPDDERAAPIFREVADSRLDVLARYTAGEYPPEIRLGCYYRRPAPIEPTHALEPGKCGAGSRDAAISALARDALWHYSRAVGVLVRNQRYSSEELREIELQVLRTSYRLRSYAQGRQSLERLLSYRVASSEPLLARAEALLQIADWDLLFLEARAAVEATALEVYRETYALLEREGVDQASIDRLFAPEVPVALPTFAPETPGLAEAQEARDYVEVAFELNKYGEPKKISVRDGTVEATLHVRRRVIADLAPARFRPRLVDGRLVDRHPVVLRYPVAP
ncbi:MAG TPA: hypothetical protein VIN61_14680 [Gammaproteobacteria bacterium]